MDKWNSNGRDGKYHWEKGTEEHIGSFGPSAGVDAPGFKVEGKRRSKAVAIQ